MQPPRRSLVIFIRQDREEPLEHAVMLISFFPAVTREKAEEKEEVLSQTP